MLTDKPWAMSGDLHQLTTGLVAVSRAFLIVGDRDVLPGIHPNLVQRDPIHRQLETVRSTAPQPRVTLTQTTDLCARTP